MSKIPEFLTDVIVQSECAVINKLSHQECDELAAEIERWLSARSQSSEGLLNIDSNEEFSVVVVDSLRAPEVESSSKEEPFESPTLSFSEFKESRKKIDSKTFADQAGMDAENIEAEQCYTYAVPVHIEIKDINSYGLLLDRSFYDAKDDEGLEKLEKMLYDFCVQEKYVLSPK